MELFLSACSTFDKKTVSPGKQRRSVYTSEFNSDNYYGNCETYGVDTDVADIMAIATEANRSGQQQEYGSKNTFVPWDQWIKLSQEHKYKLIV
jgi:hypothetical protein